MNQSFNPFAEFFAKMCRDEAKEYIMYSLFDEMKSNDEKLQVAMGNVLASGQVPTVIPRVKKNNNLARKIRQEGNKKFVQRGVENFIEALNLYNQSLCLALPGSEEYGIALANRSAVYLALRKPEFGLKDIHNARQSGYPLKLMGKLKVREKECKKMIKNGNGKRKVNVESVATIVKPHLRCQEIEEFGKGVVTTKLVNPGEFLIVEDPFTIQPDRELRFERCWNCMEANSKYLIPCKKCTQVMYCSDECLDAAQNSYHAIECPIIDYLLGTFQEMNLLVLRTVIKSVTVFGSLRTIGMFIDEHGHTKADAFGFAKPGRYTNDDQRKFHQLYSMDNLQEKRAVSDQFQQANIAGLMYQVLAQFTSLSNECQTNKKSAAVLLNLLFHFLQSAPVNFMYHDAAASNDTCGAGSYPVAGLLNHSCSPNVIRVMRKSQQWIIALRVIKPGEQLFINYHVHFRNHPVILRQQTLLGRYFFYCKCDACKNNYPTHFKLREAKIPASGISSCCNRHSRLSDAEFKTKVDAMKAYLQTFDRHHPCSELSAVQASFEHCIQLHFANYSLDIE